MDNVLYTDGHGIKVTTAKFIAGKTTYRIDGILNARINLIKAHYAPAMVLMLVGFIGVLSGALHLIPDTAMEPITIMNMVITVNLLSIIIGALLLVTGIIMLAVQHDRYSVHIVTAEGEKDPIVSEKKD